MRFLPGLLRREKGSADELIFGGLVCIFGLNFFTAWDVMRLHHEFSQVAFAGAVATILGAIAAAIAGRDKVAPPPDAPQKP